MCPYVNVARVSEIPENRMRAFEVQGQKILIANVEGRLYAVSDNCPHMSYPLYMGSLNGRILTCGFHYAKFDVTTGEVLSPPAQEPLKTFKIKVQNDTIVVKL